MMRFQTGEKKKEIPRALESENGGFSSQSSQVVLAAKLSYLNDIFKIQKWREISAKNTNWKKPIFLPNDTQPKKKKKKKIVPFFFANWCSSNFFLAPTVSL